MVLLLVAQMVKYLALQKAGPRAALMEKTMVVQLAELLENQSGALMVALSVAAKVLQSVA